MIGPARDLVDVLVGLHKRCLTIRTTIHLNQDLSIKAVYLTLNIDDSDLQPRVPSRETSKADYVAVFERYISGASLTILAINRWQYCMQSRSR